MPLDSEAISELIVNPLELLSLPLGLVALAVMGMVAGRVLNDRRKLLVVSTLIVMLMFALLAEGVRSYDLSLAGDHLVARRAFCPPLASGSAGGKTSSLVALWTWAMASVAVQFLVAELLSRRRKTTRP